ncbi:MAG: GNAT family N-acetyltransferase [Thaumarchaeota archaeon]|nr:GNAT family N-acetyltransferase [Nitrososphaerota archaeon]MDE1840431.1 GNAT family N-acetyltransferase [Nitrososphaerota archaeon]MDE1878153.1 GNAT family N-acetyltransferase [Nitrososphaerota archaeon]
MALHDIQEIIELQKESFPYMTIEGMIWKEESLENHLHIFPDGQFVAEINGKIVASASSLIVKLSPEYKEHTWSEVCGGSSFRNHDPKGDSLYGADVSTHPRYRSMGIGTKLYDARKDLVMRLNLRRIIAGGRLFNYCEHADRLSPEEYVKSVLAGKIREPVLYFQTKNGFKFIKILPNYIKDSRSLNYATFIEWKNPHYKESA